MQRFVFLICSAGLLASSAAWGQQVTVSAPATAVESGFSERFGVGFNLNHPSFSIGFRNGPSGGSFGGGGFGPPLGGSSISIPLRGGKLNGNLFLSAEQGSYRSMTTTAPLITLTNGVPGFVGSGTLEPFVTGLFPVLLSGGPEPTSPVRGMLERGDIQLRKDPSGQTRLFIPEPPARRPAQQTDTSDSRPPLRDANSAPDSSNPFRRAMEKYAGSKR